MEYEEFLARYRQSHQDWGAGRVSTAGAAAEIDRLRAMVPSVEPPDRRASAESALDRFAAEISPESQDRMGRAVNAIADASEEDGTVQERIARAEQGLRTVTAIANESGDDDERYAILSMNESLAMIIMELRRTDDGR